MLNLKNITLRNFLSIGNVTQAIRLDHGLALVLGNNTDSNGGTTKNGAQERLRYFKRSHLPSTALL